MSEKYATAEMRRALAAWARARGIAAPTDQGGMRRLVTQFLSEMVSSVGAQSIGGGMPAMDQMAHAENHINLLRDSGGLTDVTEPETEDSDFGDLIRQRADAMEQAGGDDLAAAAIVNKQNKAATAAAAPFTSSNPASAMDSPLGNKVTLGVGDLKEVARWTGQSIEARAVTVMVGLVSFSHNTGFGVAAGGEYRPYLSLMFGSQGFLYSAEVDVFMGAQFTVNGSMVVLTMGMTAGSTADPPGATADVVGMISFEPCVRTAPLTRSIYFDLPSVFPSNPGNFNATQSIPNFAKRFWVLRTVPTVEVIVQIAVGTVQYKFSVPAGPADGDTSTPAFTLPTGIGGFVTAPGATVSMGGAASTNVTLVFELGI